MLKVMVQMLALAIRPHQFQLPGLQVAFDVKTPTWLYRREHADQTLLHPVTLLNLPRRILLAHPGILQMEHRPAGLLRHLQGTRPRPAAEFLGMGPEILEQMPAGKPQKPSQTRRISQHPNRPAKPQAIPAADYAGDFRHVTLYKRTHGVAPGKGEDFNTLTLTQDNASF
jgi:hypothetical protein